MAENRGPTDDKIFEMHGTLATLTESVRQLREDMSNVPMTAADIATIKVRVAHMQEEITELKDDQKVIEAAQIFFRVTKWVLGMVALCGGAYAFWKNIS